MMAEKVYNSVQLHRLITTCRAAFIKTPVIIVDIYRNIEWEIFIWNLLGTSKSPIVLF